MICVVGLVYFRVLHYIASFADVFLVLLFVELCSSEITWYRMIFTEIELAGTNVEESPTFLTARLARCILLRFS